MKAENKNIEEKQQKGKSMLKKTEFQLQKNVKKDITKIL